MFRYHPAITATAATDVIASTAATGSTSEPHRQRLVQKVGRVHAHQRALIVLRSAAPGEAEAASFIAAPASRLGDGDGDSARQAAPAPAL